MAHGDDTKLPESERDTTEEEEENEIAEAMVTLIEYPRNIWVTLNNNLIMVIIYQT